MTGNKLQADPPLISILIPVRDDLPNLQTCLRSLTREINREGIEVLVCDDGSAVPLEETSLQEIIRGIRVFRIRGGGPARARNYLAEKAGGEYLFFVDADTEFSGNTLTTARRIIRENPDLQAFIGSYDDSPGTRTTISMYKNLSHHYVHHRSAGRVSTFWTGCGVIRRAVFLEFGGFNEHYLKPSIEDIELGMRMAREQREIMIFPELQVKHNKAWTLASWLRADLFLRGIPWIRLMRTRGQWLPQLNFTFSHRLSAVLVLLLIPATPASFLLPGLAWMAAGLLFLFIALNFNFFRFLRKRAGFPRALLMVPLHMLYYLVAALSLGLGLASALIHGPLEE